MSFNGSGLFEINTAGQPVVNGTAIDPTVFNALTADLATGLSTCLTKDGQTTPTANLSLGNNKIVNLAAGTARTDAASLATIQDGTGVYCGTAGGTVDALTLSPSPAIAAYAAGQKFWCLTSGANTGAVTVAVSGLAAKSVKKNGTTALVANDLLAGAMIGLEYDGTNFQILHMGHSIIGTLATAVSDISAIQSNGLSKTIVDAKGDLLVGTADNTVARKAVGTNGYLLVADSTQSDGLQWVAPASAISTMGAIINGTLAVTMAANAVTIALKTASGADPSASDPVSIIFRHGTATSGTYLVRTVTAALSTVISSGSSAGTLNNTASRIYVGALDNAGTVELCWWNPVNTTGLFGFSESEPITTTAEGGAGGADSAHVVYSTTSRSAVYARYLGYFESIQVTAGTWASAATKIQLMGPGIKRTGDRIQMKRVADGAFTSGTTLLPKDNTTPQNTEGDQYLSVTITPTNAIHLLVVTVKAHYSHSADGRLTQSLFQDTSANALKSSYITAQGANVLSAVTLDHTMTAGTTSATSLKIRAGSAGAGTTYFNGESGAGLFNGTLDSFIEVQEIVA